MSDVVQVLTFEKREKRGRLYLMPSVAFGARALDVTLQEFLKANHLPPIPKKTEVGLANMPGRGTILQKYAEVLKMMKNHPVHKAIVPSDGGSTKAEKDLASGARIIHHINTTRKLVHVILDDRLAQVEDKETRDVYTNRFFDEELSDDAHELWDYVEERFKGELTQLQDYHRFVKEQINRIHGLTGTRPNRKDKAKKGGAAAADPTGTGTAESSPPEASARSTSETTRAKRKNKAKVGVAAATDPTGTGTMERSPPGRASARSTSSPSPRAANTSGHSGGSGSDDDSDLEEDVEEQHPGARSANSASGSRPNPSGRSGKPESDDDADPQEEREERITDFRLENARLVSELAAKDQELRAAKQKVLSLKEEMAQLKAQNSYLSTLERQFESQLNAERNRRFIAESEAMKILDDFKAYAAANENSGEGGMEGDEESSDEYQSEKEE
jgi:hypothetical protein